MRLRELAASRNYTEEAYEEKERKLRFKDASGAIFDLHFDYVRINGEDYMTFISKKICPSKNS